MSDETAVDSNVDGNRDVSDPFNDSHDADVQYAVPYCEVEADNFDLLSLSSLSGGMPTPHLHNASVLSSRLYVHLGSLSDDDVIARHCSVARVEFAKELGLDVSGSSGGGSEWNTDASDDVRLRRSASAPDVAACAHQLPLLSDSFASDVIDDCREEEADEYLSREPTLTWPRMRVPNTHDTSDSASSVEGGRAARRAKHLLFIPPQGDFAVNFDDVMSANTSTVLTTSRESGGCDADEEEEHVMSDDELRTRHVMQHVQNITSLVAQVD